MTIQKYLKIHKLKRKQLLAMLSEKGWKPSEASLSRWIAGKSKPGPAARVVLREVSGGEIC